ncbi:Multidrug resistance protein 3 [Paramyrothecium foliicola]|nr:Multidrug resistance protein 3 [Paramyrothecium foliicola]
MTAKQEQLATASALAEDGVDGTGGTNASEGPLDGQFKEASVPPMRFWFLCAGICLGLLLSLIDTSIVATSLYSIGIEFGTSYSVKWVALTYTLAYLGCAVTFSRISDVVGRRNAFVAAYILFFAFSLACGFAQNLEQLIGFRVLQGIGGSGLYSLSMIILPELCPPNVRQYMGAVIGLVVAGSGLLGPVIGGILTNYASWRWVFFINGPIGFVSMCLFFLMWPKAEQLPDIEKRKWREFDYLGSCLVIAAAVLVVFAFQNAGEAEALGSIWGKAVFIAPLATGLLCWAGVAGWSLVIERKFAHKIVPNFPINLFRNRSYSAAAATTLFLGFPYLLIVFSFPLRAQVVSQKSALMAGVMLLPMLGTTAFGTVVCGGMNATKNRLFESLFFGACLMTLSCGLLSTVSGPEDDSKALGFLTFAGIGFGFATTAATMLPNFEAPIRDHAPAQGILAQLRILGGSLGISMSTVQLAIEVEKYMKGIVSPEDRARLGKADVQLSMEQQRAITLAYSESFRKGMMVATIVSGTAAILALGAYRRHRTGLAEQRQKLMDDEIAYRAAKREAELAQGI